MPPKPSFSIEEEQIRFERQYTQSQGFQKTFGQQAIEIIENMGLNYGKAFADATLLNPNVLSRMKNDPSGRYELATVISICAGLDLDIATTERLLCAAGLALSPASRTHQAYRYVIANMPGIDIDSRNAFLESLGIAPLGSREYNK